MGELDRLGFNCTLCQFDKDLRAYRGCGVAPDLGAGSGALPVFDEHGRPLERPAINLWDAQAYIDEHYKEHPGTPLDPLGASEVYMHAGQCWVHEFTGDLWPWCPAWLARFYQGPHAAFADHVISLAGLATRGLLAWAVREQPTGAEVAGVNIGLGLRERLKIEGEERAYREEKEKREG